MYRVKDVMTDEVASCGLDDSLETAVRIMRERGCGSVPIVDANLHVVAVSYTHLTLPTTPYV